MARQKKPLGSADGRPRIHIRQSGKVAVWSIGPVGLAHRCEDLGDAFFDAIESIGYGPAVIIWEGSGPEDGDRRTHGGDSAIDD